MKVTLLMIGADYHPGFQQIAFVIPILGSSRNGGYNTLRKRKSSTAISRPRECNCAWGWKRAGRHAGLSGCSRSCIFNCGSEMPRRSGRRKEG
jgi:hypothetical protein